MPSWNELLTEFEKQPGEFLRNNLQKYLNDISSLREDRNVIFYASAFLQKPEAPQTFVQITYEDLNGFMATLYGMNWEKGLTLLLHTSGGLTNAAETIVEYLYQKFQYIEVIIPTFAMSAGTMISLAANKIIMGRQSQLGPIDPQMPLSGRFVSAQSVVDQFKEAKKEILNDAKVAPVWYPKAVLSAYHLVTLAFEKSPATKLIESNHDRRWIKNWVPVQIKR